MSEFCRRRRKQKVVSTPKQKAHWLCIWYMQGSVWWLQKNARRKLKWKRPCSKRVFSLSCLAYNRSDSMNAILQNYQPPCHKVGLWDYQTQPFPTYDFISMCICIYTDMPAYHQSAVPSSQQGCACAAMQARGSGPGPWAKHLHGCGGAALLTARHCRLVACRHVCVYAYAHWYNIICWIMRV